MWLDKMLTSSANLVAIVCLDNVSVGLLQIVELSAMRSEISILIHPEYRARNIGTAALRLARKLMPGVTFQATIHKNNKPSLHMFSKEGYEEIDKGEWVTLIQKVEVSGS